MSEPRRLFALAIAAALVLGACGGGEGELSTEPQATQTADLTEAAAADIVVVGTSSVQFEPSQMEAEAGTISVALTSTGGEHTFTVELDEGTETVVAVFPPELTATGEIELEAGTYRFFCAIPGHSMEGTLTVT
jgi:plastocyanin